MIHYINLCWPFQIRLFSSTDLSDLDGLTHLLFIMRFAGICFPKILKYINKLRNWLGDQNKHWGPVGWMGRIFIIYPSGRKKIYERIFDGGKRVIRQTSKTAKS